MYYNGNGVEPDPDMALTWYERASFHGTGLAVYNLAWRYLDESFMEPDEATAVAMFERAASLGCLEAMLILGDGYYYGYYGLEENEAMALDWYNVALEDNSPEAMYQIGKIYYYGGDYIAEDEATAAEWFRRAADNGSAGAMNYLGYMYVYGQGVEVDYAAALDLFVQAAWSAGDDENLTETIRDDIDLLVQDGYTTWDEVNALIG